MKSNKGVSLVELSIAIAVIGLLLAAVVGGLGVRKSAELRGILSEIGGFQNAIEGFYSKYNALPGDMPDAHTRWDNGANTVCGTAAQCNGDNNGRIEFAASLDSESYRAWQHLDLADFYSWGYKDNNSNAQADIGINVPASKRTKVGYSIYYDNDATAATFDHEMATGEGSRNQIMIGAFYAGNINNNAALTPLEAITIDKKIDNDVPGTGAVHSLNGSDVVLTADADGTGNNCILGTAYNMANLVQACIMTFPIRP